jgi:hypothetical protein
MEPWAPVLSVQELGYGCRLSLSGIAHADGRTLQDAADALVARVLDVAYALRDGASFPPGVPTPQPGTLAFLYRIGELAERCEDVRGLVLGGRD